MVYRIYVLDLHIRVHDGATLNFEMTILISKVVSYRIVELYLSVRS